MRLIGYVRVSSVSQAQGYGLEVQRRAIEGYCVLHGHELLGIEEEVRSALKSRPVFDRVKEKVLNGGTAGLIAYRLDRIGRSVKDLATIAEEFQRGEGSDLRAERHQHLDSRGEAPLQPSCGHRGVRTDPPSGADEGREGARGKAGEDLPPAAEDHRPPDPRGDEA